MLFPKFYVRIWCVTESDSARIFGALRCVAVRCGALRCVAVRGGAWRCVAVRGDVFSAISDVWRTEKFSLLIGRRCPAVHTQGNPNKQHLSRIFLTFYHFTKRGCCASRASRVRCGFRLTLVELNDRAMAAQNCYACFPRIQHGGCETSSDVQ
jgi:hypothetical protein